MPINNFNKEKNSFIENLYITLTAENGTNKFKTTN